MLRYAGLTVGVIGAGVFFKLGQGAVGAVTMSDTFQGELPGNVIFLYLVAVTTAAQWMMAWRNFKAAVLYLAIAVPASLLLLLTGNVTALALGPGALLLAALMTSGASGE
jgi:hypothetical protein